MTSQAHREQTSGSNKRSSAGFTLIELLVGIAVSSILLMGLFQLLGELTTLRATFREQSRRTHRRVALQRLLYQDLYSLPAKKSEFQGTPDEFYRTTVAHSGDRGLLLESRVHYFTRRQDDKINLLRETRWVDLQDGYENQKVLFSAESIQFRYITKSGRTVRSSSGANEAIAGVHIKTGDLSLTVPVAKKPEDKSDGEGGSGSVPARQ